MSADCQEVALDAERTGVCDCIAGANYNQHSVSRATEAPIWVFRVGCVGQHFSLLFSAGAGMPHGRRRWSECTDGDEDGVSTARMVGERLLAVAKPPKLDQSFQADGKRKRFTASTSSHAPSCVIDAQTPSAPCDGQSNECISASV
ncbi:hypothetical protein Tdes44962_MAKER07754 [Teratosphaeria destructans]|uniref:Uncharacterized protein n=1 Tax=Teratosphaeria destructans TaxID=418781 RepID=A0A9W7W5S7_9PEZI|nr:hypothetical protein Tdes44962_MAKER07754 [Teratosphaeria destructans]